jgi:hypothetical protein
VEGLLQILQQRTTELGWLGSSETAADLQQPSSSKRASTERGHSETSPSSQAAAARSAGVHQQHQSQQHSHAERPSSSGSHMSKVSSCLHVVCSIACWAWTEATHSLGLCSKHKEDVFSPCMLCSSLCAFEGHHHALPKNFLLGRCIGVSHGLVRYINSALKGKQVL